MIEEMVARKEEQNRSAWIDREKKVVSFQQAEGFEEVEFSTHDEMFAFVIKQTESGYRIQ